jgi:arabinofuranosyltransferase
MIKRNIIFVIILAVFAALFIFHALSLSFTQDDAYISYRYVRNFLAGEGLVYNAGERVEGYTNFFLIILMIFFGLLKLNYMIISKIIGITSGVGIFIIIALWVNKLFERRHAYFILSGVLLLLAANGALAYWAISGLETVLFAFLIFWGIYLAANKNILFVPILAIATLTRPEGGMILLLVILYYLFTKTYSRKTIGKLFLMYIVLLLPQVIFRLYYYHEILPNPFYAKTGWSLEYFQSGLQYVWLFLRHYGFYGLLIIAPIALYKFLPRTTQLLLLVAIVYTFYILMVGGDVLHGDRFFVPLLPLMYVLFVIVLYRLTEIIIPNRNKIVPVVLGVVIIAAGLLTFLIPRHWIDQIHFAEVGLTNRMKAQADYIRSATSKHLTIACSTIGAFGYYSDADIIDMLGLTDTTIAKHPQSITAIKSSWKERNYNIPYLMKRQPDLILFSTGLKPSAPAEKALFLSSEFRKGYYPIYHDVGNRRWAIYKHKDGYKYEGEDRYYPNAEFIDLYAEALVHFFEERYDLALEYARQSMLSAPPDFYELYTLLGGIMMEKKDPQEALRLLQQAVVLSDGYALQACDVLRRFYDLVGDTAKVEEYNQIILEHNRLD